MDSLEVYRRTINPRVIYFYGYYMFEKYVFRLNKTYEY